MFLKSGKLHCEGLEQNGLFRCENKASPSGMKDTQLLIARGEQPRIKEGLGDSKEKHVIHRVKHSVITKTELCVPSGAGTTADLGLITMCDKHFFFKQKGLQYWPHRAAWKMP